MDWKLELVSIPVTDVDRAKTFYVNQVGFNADHDHQVNDALRFVQLTPPGSACSVVLGTGITDMAPGSQRGVQIVVEDVDAARQHLIANGVAASEVDVQPWGSFVPSAIPMAIRGRCSNYRRDSWRTRDGRVRASVMALTTGGPLGYPQGRGSLGRSDHDTRSGRSPLIGS
jgi:catechol 2,3-dioxygenase-like lactoylglutathione lyase family enzyme